MTPAVSLYPASPPEVPTNFTAPGGSYKLRVVFVLASLVVFFFFYLGLVVGIGGLTILFLTSFPLVIIGLLLAPFSGLFLLFLIKGLFNRRQIEKEARVEIFADEQPRLFEFIRQLCAETNAPFPHRVFVSYEVNAAVFYDDSLLSLFRRTPKNLLIGLGLVHLLNLSEFKAVLAHEFGHFSQSSMKLGIYVYTANRIIGDMVFARDWLDHLAWDWSNSQNGLASAAGWTVRGLLASCRKVLEGFFYAINFLNLSLSRQMEFNADLVAVSVAGSDAFVNCLARAGFANSALMQAFNDLAVAADHQLFSWDLFPHQAWATEYLRLALKDPHLGERPPALPPDASATVEVFDPGDKGGMPVMWAAHPPNHDREQNVKRHYLFCPTDDRCPWLLFDNPQELRQRVTWKFYRVALKLKRELPLADPSVVQAFIRDEHAETTYDPRYHGLYDGRRVKPGEVLALARSVHKEPLPSQALALLHDGLYAGDFPKRMREYALLRQEIDTLAGLESGRLELTGETFTFRSRRYGLQDLDRLLTRVRRNLDEELEWLAGLDCRVFSCHFQMALELDDDAAKQLLDRYQFHLTLQDLSRDVFDERDNLESALAWISTKEQITTNEFVKFRDAFRDAHEALAACLRGANKLRLPELKNLRAGEQLSHFLLEKQLVQQFSRSVRGLTAKKVNKFLGQMGEVSDRLRRIHFKSLGAILALQEKLAREWKARQPLEATVAVTPIVVEEPAASIIPPPLPSPSISLSCPSCRTKHELPEAIQGRRLRCMICREVIAVRAAHQGEAATGEIVCRPPTAAKPNRFDSTPLDRSRAQREGEIAERPGPVGPVTGDLLASLGAALCFLVVLGSLTVIYWTLGNKPDAPPGVQPGTPPGVTRGAGLQQAGNVPSQPGRKWTIPPGFAGRKVFADQPYRFLADLTEFDVQAGPWPITKGGCGNGQPVKVGRISSPRALGMHPPNAPGVAAARFFLGKQAEVFRATVAINETSNWCFSPAIFTVWGDGKELWRSKWIAHNHAHTQECQVPVKGVQVLELRVQCVNGNVGVHAVWVEPRLLKKDDSPDPAKRNG